MEKKYQEEVHEEINFMLKKIQLWRNLFFITTEYYLEGWSIILKEKNAYPRRIVIFKSYNTNSFSIKSFEIDIIPTQKEKYEELYFVDNIRTSEELLRELKELIYGKDLINRAKKELIKKLS